MKKLWMFLAVLSLSICFIGCGGSKSSDKSEVQESAKTIFFTEDNVSVELYESKTLLLQNAEGKTLTWRSANPEKLTVDENGVAFAKMAGTVTVYVSDGEFETACSVTIINSGYIPLLKLDVPETVKIMEGDTFMLSPYVTYNGVQYTNASFTYSATGSVSVAETGEITANSVGAGMVAIKATWNGVECETLTMELEVLVIE